MAPYRPRHWSRPTAIAVDRKARRPVCISGGGRITRLTTEQTVPTDRACSGHLWRMRDMTHALPGVYITEVCAQCGALRIDELDDLLHDLCDA